MFFKNPVPQLLSDHNHDNVEILLFFCVFWTGLYILLHKMIGGENTKKMLDTKNRAVSIVHGLLSFSLACIDVFGHKCSMNQPTSNFQSNILLSSLGYFLYDLIACYYYGLFDMDLLIHHAVASLGLAWGVFSGWGASCAITGIVITEVSNFPMHVRNIARNFGRKHTKIYEYNERAYFFLYIVSRGIFGPECLIRGLRSKNNPWVPCIVCALLCLQSYMFMGKMFKIIKRKIA